MTTPERQKRIDITVAFLRNEIDWAGQPIAFGEIPRRQTMLFYEMAAFLQELVDREGMPDAVVQHAEALLRRFEEAHR